MVSSYKPSLWDVDSGTKQREAVDPAIHLLVQHGADTNKKDRSVQSGLFEMIDMIRHCLDTA